MPIRGSTGGWALLGRVAAVALASTVPSLAMDSTQFLRAMAGRWVGDGLTLLVDADTLQANLDPEKPFEWRSLHILNVSGNLGVFDIGPDRFLGLIDADGTMTLTKVGVLGQYRLYNARGRP